MNPDPGNSSVDLTDCPCCSSAVRAAAFTQMPLEKKGVAYCSRKNCKLLQTQLPHRLAETYPNPNSGINTGTLRRNLANARLLTFFLGFAFPDAVRCVAITGGRSL